MHRKYRKTVLVPVRNTRRTPPHTRARHSPDNAPVESSVWQDAARGRHWPLRIRIGILDAARARLHTNEEAAPQKVGSNQLELLVEQLAHAHVRDGVRPLHKQLVWAAAPHLDRRIDEQSAVGQLRLAAKSAKPSAWEATSVGGSH
eukprot:6165598-Prymnesium_polylepis.1